MSYYRCLAHDNRLIIDFDCFHKALWKGLGRPQTTELGEIKAISPRAQGQGKFPNDVCIM